MGRPCCSLRGWRSRVGAMIDLLPWRERGRRRSRRRFLGNLAISMLLGLALLIVLERRIDGSVMAGTAETRRLRDEIGLLGARGAEAERLRQEQEDAALHMQVLSGLQRSRPLLAQVLSELSAHLPDAAWYRRLSHGGGEVRIEGLAESHAAVAELMRELSASPRFLEARLAGVTEAAPGLFEFSLVLRLDETGD
ncbi:MAG: PilN domain-containing protein [Gammaproteobacteria bacterium]|nr:PilN domain-containing protein [Gammaproteobacteria bacterium]MYG95553.1 PilN domain-containing protein [Gammaproteobacteria bacterium]